MTTSTNHGTSGYNHAGINHLILITDQKDDTANKQNQKHDHILARLRAEVMIIIKVERSNDGIPICP
jgi:hypothetical protein